MRAPLAESDDESARHCLAVAENALGSPAVSPLLWIICSSLAMSFIGLIGALTLLLPEKRLKALLLPLVALSAGSLLGGALFHMLPEVTERMQGQTPFLWVAGGFISFFVLEQFLHWHHCHRATSEHHEPLTYLLLVSDTVHNFVGGVAVGASFIIDVRVGITVWLAAAAHEVPQELGDFGALVHGGWSPRRALLYNFASALTFLCGGLVAYASSSTLDLTFVVAFAAGNFIYIGAVDLVPEINKHHEFKTNFVHFICFTAGMAILVALTHLFHAH